MKKVTDKRSALLQAALELFAENGFNGSPTALIAKRAGVASGTLYIYFKNKEELIRELFREVRAQIDSIALENSEGMTIRERFLQAFSRILRYFLTNPKEFKFVEQYHFSPLCERGCSTTGENESLRNLLVQACEQKVIKEAPLLILESIAFGPILLVAKEHASHGTPINEDMIEQIVHACWDGLKR
jgi:AcrR family transcriptional regulator